MKLLGQGMYWQDMKVGDKYKTYGRTITETDIVNFISCTGFLEVLFTDMEYVREHSAIKGRLAPGALVYALAEGLSMLGTIQGTGLAFLGMELDVKGPTFAGDTIHVEIEVIEQRAASKGGRGLVRTRNSVINQRGETVLVFTPLRLMAGRPQA
ncbi:MAG: MaoC family dehydratase N-terminal domain-containing protein [Bacteroidota bacterium]|jgi:acyl dehydratase|nr:MaoC family dehydratase N-terminal domain-containing protein [Hyphomicrobiaceae bacterium]